MKRIDIAIGMMASFTVLFVVITIGTLAMYGGENLSYIIPNCEALTVNITNSTYGEWDLNCTEETAGNFYCNCTDGYNLTLMPRPDSIGNFSITITSYYKDTQSVQTSSYSGSNWYTPSSCKQIGYSCTQFQTCCSGLSCISNICKATMQPMTTTTSTTSTTATLPAVTTTTTVPETTTTTLPTEGNDYTVPIIITIAVTGVSLLIAGIWFATRGGET